MATPRWTIQRQNSGAENFHLAPVNNSNPGDIAWSSGIILEPGGELILPGKNNLRVGDEINSLKSTVLNGKQAIAQAISNKGVAASGGEDFNSLASKINSIQTGGSGKSESFERRFDYPYANGYFGSSNWAAYPDVTVYTYDNGDTTNYGDYYTFVFKQDFSFKPSSIRIYASVNDKSDWRGPGFSSLNVIQFAANDTVYYTRTLTGGPDKEVEFGSGVNSDRTRGQLLNGNLLAPTYGVKLSGNTATIALQCSHVYVSCPSIYMQIVGV